ncbi:hypothetical protein SAMN02745121_03912 [Nannocystis exedens]|uniref:Uncharacterized protein n=1 Tax=Nannocystis exedens TaxID=54 RepID=A0A1I1ZQS8_9BACT|nr:hypothetical protein [Nannocystis exedens]SFE34079.1 hypothetical protein SAMN02745121_03912 [Nannocystis exedens]
MSAAHLLSFVLALQAPEQQAADAIQWRAPAGCPDRAALLAGIARRRGKPLEPGQARVVARARAQGPHRYRLQLELEVAGRRERRVLHARTCEALVDGVALVVALAVDGNPGAPPLGADLPGPADPPLEPDPPLAPGVVSPPGSPATPPETVAPPSDGPATPAGTVPSAPGSAPTPPAAPVPPASRSPATPPTAVPPASNGPATPAAPVPPAPGAPATVPEPVPVRRAPDDRAAAPGSVPVAPAPEPAAAPESPLDAPVDRSPPDARARWRPGGFLRLHGLGEVGALPGPTGGVGLAGGLLWRWFRLEVHAGYLAPRLLDRPELRARVSLFTVAVHGCARLGRGRLEVPICLGAEAGGIPAVADTGRAALGRWLALTGGVGAAVRVHPRVALWAFLQGLAAVQRGTLAVREPGPDGELRILYDPGTGSARLALGVEVKFGDPR